ncbi:DUF6946 family protein [Paraburkholderia sediminicola]|uniref:DUF6946 family protein n=1 Tax=Paraburkholderia sediminicola TaxID=458836 RepID=UPI0038BB54B8
MGDKSTSPNSVEDWAQFLAEPVRHWRTGHSARNLAHCWQDADCFPLEVAEVLATTEVCREKYKFV